MPRKPGKEPVVKDFSALENLLVAPSPEITEAAQEIEDQAGPALEELVAAMKKESSEIQLSFEDMYVEAYDKYTELLQTLNELISGAHATLASHEERLDRATQLFVEFQELKDNIVAFINNPELAEIDLEPGDEGYVSGETDQDDPVPGDIPTADSPDLPPASPDAGDSSATPEDTPTSATFDNKRWEDLADLYRSDEAFKKEDGSYRSLAEIKGPVLNFLGQLNISKEERKDFEKEFRKYSKVIASLNEAKSELKGDKDKRAELNEIKEKLASQYQELGILLASTIDTLAEDEEFRKGVEADISPEDDFVVINERFDKVRAELVVRDVDVATHPEIVRGEEGLQKLAKAMESEQDAGIKQHLMISYTNVLRKIVEALEAELATMPAPEPVPTPPEPTPVDPEAGRRAWRESVGLPSERQTDAMSPEDREKQRLHYAEHRKQSIESRKVFKGIEKSYQDGLKNYYENRSFLNKTVNGARKLFGFEPKLPAEIVQLQVKYKEARKDYAYRLNEALERRDSAEPGNKDFQEGSESTKRAFGKKFVLKPRQKMLEMQEKVLADQDAKSRFKKVLVLMGKHKTATRLIGFGTAATVGFLGAGALGAGYGGARWLVSTLGGAAAAEAVYKKQQKGVEQMKQKGQSVSESVTTDFALASLDQLDDSLAQADLEIERAELRQKAYAVGAAVAVGGAVNAGGALADSYFDITGRASVGEGLRAGAPEAGPNASFSDLSGVENLDPTDNNRLSSGSDRLNSAEAAAAAAEAVPNFKLLDSVSVPIYGLDGTSVEQVVSGIEFKGLHTDALRVPVLQLEEMQAFTRLVINDLLSAHPNMTPEQVEDILMGRLEGRYSGEAWWQNAEINEVKIGSIAMKVPDVDGVDLAVHDDVMDNRIDPINDRLTDEAAAAELAKQAYEVKSGDTLWKIMKTQYGDTLKGLSEPEQNRALDALFDKARIDPELRDSIGLNPKAQGNIDRIWPDDKLHLGELGEELKEIVKEQQAHGPRLSSGVLPVSGAESVNNIPISSTASADYIGGDALYSGADTVPTPDASLSAAPSPYIGDDALYQPEDTAPKAVDATSVSASLAYPKTGITEAFSFSGNYLDTPEYNDFILQQFPSQEAFAKIVEQEALKFEGKQYGFFDKLTQDLKSPYELLADKTLAEISELQKTYPTADAMKQYAAANDLKYEALEPWFGEIDKLTHNQQLPHTANTTLADLYGRAVAQAVTKQA